MASRKTPSSPPRTVQINTVQINLEGKTYTGSYTVDAEIITVSYGDMRKTAHLGGFASAPASLARLVLTEMAIELQKKRKWP